MLAEAGGDQKKVLAAKEISMSFKRNALTPQAYIASLSELFGESSLEVFVDDLAALLKNAAKREALRKAIVDFRLRRRQATESGSCPAECNWTCSSCTFENDSNEDRCGMCGSTSPAELRAVVQSGFSVRQ